MRRRGSPSPPTRHLIAGRYTAAIMAPAAARLGVGREAAGCPCGCSRGAVLAVALTTRSARHLRRGGSGAAVGVAPGAEARLLPFCGRVGAVLVFLINPFASAQGLTPIWTGPRIPVLDTEITQEELAPRRRPAAGPEAPLPSRRSTPGRGDRVLAAVARVAPHSALIAALATRLLPTLERDAGGLALAARARGGRSGGPRGRELGPLVSLSLERSLSLAEAMEARGTAAGRGRAPPPRPGPRAAASGAAGGGPRHFRRRRRLLRDRCRYYDLLGDPVTTAASARPVAVLVLAAPRW